MIFYLSCTGNTRWAVDILSAITGEEAVDIAKAESDKFALRKDERIGFCFPVHGWRPPLVVRKFMKRLTLENLGNNYCYALCTAGDTTGEAMDIFCKDADNAGLHIDSTFSLLMPESYVGLPFMDVDTPENEKKKKQAASQRLARYSEYIANRTRGIHELDIGRWPKTNSRIIGSLFLKCLVTDKYFHVEKDKCIRCGKCAYVCPVGNIEGGKGVLPVWRHDNSCLACFACYHHCPEHAIEYGCTTKHKGQYWFSKNEKKD